MNNPRTRKAILILTLTIATLASTICLNDLGKYTTCGCVYGDLESNELDKTRAAMSYSL